MILFLVLLFIYNTIKYENNVEKYERYIYAVLQWHMFMLGMLYVLSVIRKVNILFISLGIIFINILLIIIIWKKIKIKDWTSSRINLNIRESIIPTIKKIGFFAIPICMFLIVLLITIKTVPYNYDSMTYHLPRIAHWAQNQTIAPYASNIDRQIGSTRIASYICLYVYILAGKTDVLVNLVQCMAYGTSALMVYAISRKMKLGKELSILASVFFLAMPIAIAEATTTQNDNYASMWLLFFVYLLLDFNDKQIRLQDSVYTKRKVFYIASCVALGYLTKPAVCFAMLIFLIWTLICVISRKDDVKLIMKLLCIGILTCILYVLPSILENIVAFGSISPSNVGKAQLVGTFKINYLVINFLKTFTYNFGNSLIPNMKDWMSKILYFIADILCVDINDASISENATGYGFSSYPYGCDTALQPFLMTLVLLGCVWCVIRKKNEEAFKKEYCYSSVLSFIMLCIFMRWHHFITRYMIGYFALFCPLIVIQLVDFIEVFKSRIVKRILLLFISVICLINFMLAIKNNWDIDTKEYPRTYFYHVGGSRNDYEKMCDVIRQNGYDEIGLHCGVNSYEYPLWGILQYDKQEYIIRHIFVEGDLAKYEDKKFSPDCLLFIDSGLGDVVSYNGHNYKKMDIEVENYIFLYEKVIE